MQPTSKYTTYYINTSCDAKAKTSVYILFRSVLKHYMHDACISHVTQRLRTSACNLLRNLNVCTTHPRHARRAGAAEE